MRTSARIPVPIWVALIAAIPLAVLFVLSLAAAAAVATLIGVAYWLLAPRRPTDLPRRSEPPRGVEIELDPRDYRRIPDERTRG